MARTACEAMSQELDVEAVQRWLELEVAKLKLAAKQWVESYFREGRERSVSHKLWPRLKGYQGRSFYVVWCRKDYVNPKRGIVRTQHISRGQGSYRRRLSQICQHLEPEERALVLRYEERFQAIRQMVEMLTAMLVQLDRYQQILEKEQKNIVFGHNKTGGAC